MTKVVPECEMRGDSAEDTCLLREMFREAKEYLEAFHWCGGIKDSFFGLGVGGIVGVFLFNIVPAAQGVDDWVWVIVGDLPPAYITVDNAHNPARALDGYMGEMAAWAEAAMNGLSVDDLIPVNVPPTRENALALRSRLEFLDEMILPDYRNDLSEAF